jgi:diguanylate cyclase (GGDEF)-like protein
MFDSGPDTQEAVDGPPEEPHAGWQRMKIGDNRPMSGTPLSSARERSEMATGALSGSGRTVTDAVSFMGIPEAELTPKVRDALMGLLAEVDKLRREMEQVRRRLKDAEALADRDPLLPVLNRRAFVRELSRVIAYARRYKEPAGLAYFDIDNFKQVNDRWGHAAGDAALAHLTRLLAEHVRETDVIGRLGGDEFAVILARTDDRNAESKARALSVLIRERPLVLDGIEIPLSISVGAIAFDGDEDPQEALARADAAMYRAKRGPQ